MRLSVTAAPWALEGAPVLLQGDMCEQMKTAKAMGYDAVELHLRLPKDAPAAEMKALGKEVGIGIATVATGMSKLVDNLCFIDDDADVRRAAVERVKEFVDWSVCAQCGVVVGSMRGVIPDIHCREKYDNRFQECMSSVLAYAEQKDVPIYLEAINRYETNYLNTAKETLEYIKVFNSRHIYVHLDTFHMNIEESSLEKAICLCGDRLGYIHFADNNRHACGDGTLNFERIIAALKDISYIGYISVECLGRPDGLTAARRSIEHLKGIVG
jgi:sugar phosphate isomerase/epimerase